MKCLGPVPILAPRLTSLLGQGGIYEVKSISFQIDAAAFHGVKSSRVAGLITADLKSLPPTVAIAPDDPGIKEWPNCSLGAPAHSNLET